MKKTDVQKMLNGISDQYINEAVDRAVTGKLHETAYHENLIEQIISTETPSTADTNNVKKPFFRTRHAVLALTAVAAATIFAVGAVLREAFPKGSVITPAGSQTDMQSSDEISDSDDSSVSNRANIMGGKGELTPIGVCGMNQTPVLMDDTGYYIYEWGLWKKYANGSNGMVTPDTPIVFSDGVALYIEEDNALYQTDSFGEKLLIMDYTKFFPDAADDRSAKELNYHVDSVRRAGDYMLYIFGTSDLGESLRLCKLSRGIPQSNVLQTITLTPLSFHENQFRFTDDGAWYLDANGGVAHEDYRNGKTVTYGMNCERWLDWFAYGDDLYYWLNTGDENAEHATLYRYHIEMGENTNTVICEPETEIMSTLGNESNLLKYEYLAGNTLYRCEDMTALDSNIISGQHQGIVHGLVCYDLSDSQIQQHVIGTEYAYAVLPYISENSQMPFTIMNANEDYLVYRNAAGDILLYDVKENRSETISEASTFDWEMLDVYEGTRTYATVVINSASSDATQNFKIQRFSPVYHIYDTQTGEELPRNESEHAQPIASGSFVDNADFTYPMTSTGVVCLLLDWSEEYGTLAGGTYEIRMTAYDYANNEIPLSREFTVTSATIVAWIDADKLTNSGATLMLQNIGDTAWMYSEGYWLRDAETGKNLIFGEQPTFHDIAYELPAQETHGMAIDWTEFYGELDSGDYILVLWTSNTDGSPIEIYFTL